MTDLLMGIPGAGEVHPGNHVCALFSGPVERDGCYPAGPAEVRIDGVDPVRVLVIGDGAAAGCGVLIHELGMAGYLARHLAQHLRRGVEVAVSAQPAASARSTLKSLEGVALGGYDATVLMLATTDAFCLTPRRRWRHSMTGLVQALKSASHGPVFVTSTASMHLTRSLSPFARRLTGSHARLLDVETRRICACSNAPMISLDAANDLTPRTYARWGRRIGAHVAGALQDRGENAAQESPRVDAASATSPPASSS